MAVVMEVFSGDPPCPGCLALLELARRFAAEYAGELEVVERVGEAALERFEAYGLTCVPAVVVNEKIRIEGLCPSEATLKAALREGGLWIK